MLDTTKTQALPNIPETTKLQEIECSSELVYVKASEVHGIGVFSRRNFGIGDTIEVFPLVPLYFRTHYQGDTRILEYSVAKKCECEECKRHGEVLCLRLGYGGIYNHQDSPNAEIVIDYTQLIGKCKAIKPISAHEEIFISYGVLYQFPEGKNTVRKEDK